MPVECERRKMEKEKGGKAKVRRERIRAQNSKMGNRCKKEKHGDRS